MKIRLAIFFLLASSFALADDIKQLAPTVVSATRVETNSFDLPVSIDVVENEKIKDANLIKEVNVNSGTVEFAKDSLNPEFTVQVKDVKNLNEITLSATDVYDNIQLIKYKIEKTESDKPIIAIEVPNASFENEIFVDNNNPDLFIKGKIRDARDRKSTRLNSSH